MRRLLVLPWFLLAGCVGRGDHSAAKMRFSLYERLGGESAVIAIVDDFVTRGLADPGLNFTRRGTDAEWPATAENVARLKRQMVQYVSASTGGPGRYFERSMTAAHRNMRITPEEFAAISADLRATLARYDVPEADQRELLAIVESTRDSIVTAPTSASPSNG